MIGTPPGAWANRSGALAGGVLGLATTTGVVCGLNPPETLFVNSALKGPAGLTTLGLNFECLLFGSNELALSLIHI